MPTEPGVYLMTCRHSIEHEHTPSAIFVDDKDGRLIVRDQGSLSKFTGFIWFGPITYPAL
jgi:hypothetical protein